MIETLGHGGGEAGFPGMDLTNGPADVVGGGLLEQEAGGT